MMHRTRIDFWSRRGIQPVEQTTPLYRCPCWATESISGRILCTICQQRANIKVTRDPLR